MKPAPPPTNDPRPDPTSVAALFVTYHPDAGFYDRALTLVGQVSAILIVDNGSTDDELAPVRRLVAEGFAELILNGENLGQAAALNQGFSWANDHGLPWVATFDQDTTPGPKLVAAAGPVFDRYRSRQIAVIGAGWIVSPRLPPDCTDPDGRDAVWVVTSCSLHSVHVWRVLGGFRGDFFIDYVDIEFCLRARSAGYTITRVCTPTMVHAYGIPTQRRFLRRTVQPSNYSPMRRYFNARNRLVVWRTYWRREARYVLFDIRAWTKELIKVLLFEDQRPQKFHAVLRGALDAIRGVTGPLPPQWIRT